MVQLQCQWPCTFKYCSKHSLDLCLQINKWWPAEGCSLQLQLPWRLWRTSSYARDDCDNLQFMYLDRICNFSNYFMEGPCDRHGMQSKAQICTVFGLNCVLQRAYLMPCKETKPYEACLIDKFSCL